MSWRRKTALVVVLSSLASVGAIALAEERRPAQKLTGFGSTMDRLAEVDPPRARQQWPSPEQFAAARRIAEERDGQISFATVGPRGGRSGFAQDASYAGASTVKAMLLVAELRRLKGAELDPATAATLRAMITQSDNDAADAIFARVGDEGMFGVARDAGMTDYTEAGSWGNARITAADMALFMARLDVLLDEPHGEFGSELLRSIAPEQSWGVPEALPKGATVRFKGGWLPHESGQLVHQMARVELDGDAYSLAVLTDAGPSMEYGTETVRLIAEALLPDQSKRR